MPAFFRTSKVYSVAGRLGLSILVAYGLVVIFHGAISLSRLLKPSAAIQASNENQVPAQQPKHDSQVVAEVPWPHFIGGGPGEPRQISLNGVGITVEEWETARSPAEILGFYSQQMAARGWSDVTEEIYSLDLGSSPAGSTNNGAEYQRYLSLKQHVHETSLALRRGAESVHVLTRPGAKPMGSTGVRLVFAATPSIKDFFSNVASNPERGMEAVQSNGAERFKTTLSVNREEPSRAFKEALAARRADGWRPVLATPGSATKPEHFAWLMKGAQYAALSVKPASQGGSSITVTEVTPQ